MKKLILIVILALGTTFANGQVTKNSDNKKSTSSSMQDQNASVKKTVIPVAELNKNITANITKNFVGYKLLEAYKVENPNDLAVAYEVQVAKGSMKQNLYYDKNGKFLSKESPTTPAPTTHSLLDRWAPDY